MDGQANTQRMILFGAGDVGIRVLHRMGGNKIYAFCDNYKAGQTIEGKKVISPDALKEVIEREKCRVVICVLSIHVACEMAQQLEEKGIEYELCEECRLNNEWGVMHLVDEEVVYLSDIEFGQCRKKKWYPLYMQMREKFMDEFIDKEINFWIYLGDAAETAYWAVKLGVVDSSYIFSFCTKAGLENIVIPVPDYIYYELPMGALYDDSIEEYKNCSKRLWESEKAFWIGNLNCHSSRKKLYLLGKENSEHLEIRSYDWSGINSFVPMVEQYRYKYLIDAKGFGWTDRLKMLFMLGRPIFINERSYVEFWMMYGMEAGKHYISVKEDFSDLLEKKKELDLSQEKYKKITEEMRCYAEKYLTKDFALKYLKDAILKYGTKEREY